MYLPSEGHPAKMGNEQNGLLYLVILIYSWRWAVNYWIMPTRESSPMAKKKPAFVRETQRNRLLKSHPKPKGKLLPTTSASLRWASLTVDQKDRRRSRLERGRLESRGTSSTCA